MQACLVISATLCRLRITCSSPCKVDPQGPGSEGGNTGNTAEKARPATPTCNGCRDAHQALPSTPRHNSLPDNNNNNARGWCQAGMGILCMLDCATASLPLTLSVTRTYVRSATSHPGLEGRRRIRLAQCSVVVRGGARLPVNDEGSQGTWAAAGTSSLHPPATKT